MAGQDKTTEIADMRGGFSMNVATGHFANGLRIAALIALFLPGVSSAQTYRWIDDTGQPNFTDDPSAIPAPMRKKAQIINAPAPAPSTDEKGEKAKGDDETRPVNTAREAAAPAPRDRVMYASIKSHGMSYMTDAVLNKSETVTMLIDTGASFTIISPKVAAKLGYADLKSLPKLPVNTAGGVSWIYLVQFDSVKVGDGEAQFVEGGISSQLGDGIDGLLGMSFLGEFIHQIDGPGGKLIMKSSRGPDTKGGHDKGWWLSKYKHYVESIHRFSAYGKSIADGVTAAEDPEMSKIKGFSEQDMRKIADYYRELLAGLDKRASSAGVPKEWRIYP